MDTETEPAPPDTANPWAEAEIESRQINWPTRGQTCELGVALTDEETVAEAHTLTAALAELDTIKSEAKASADAFKARLEEAQSAVNRSRVKIDKGTELREIECVWIYETAGMDQDGNVVIDPERRTLVRTDTFQPLRHERIPEEDRQLMMFPDETNAEEVLP